MGFAEERNRVTRISSAMRVTISAKAATDLVAHLFAEGFPARGSFRLGDSVPVEDVEIVEDRMTIAGHRQDAELFGNLFAGTGDFPLAYRVGAGVLGETAKLRHVRRRQRPADGVSDILAKPFQVMAGHGRESVVGCCICMT
ncbi:MAG: hypothetical protein Q8N40_06020 [Bradyrhizobium sp.]|nr:hypothetical protein [Bradyrhizobium sp.]